MANIVITGAGQGLGRELAMKFDYEGNNLFLIGRDLEKLKGTVTNIKNANAEIVTIDLSDSDKVNSCFKELNTKFGKINLLVNNAATWTGGISVKNLSAEKMMFSINQNFMTSFNCIKGVLDYNDSLEDICIINIGATASHRGGRNTSAFAVAKTSLRILTESIARELGEEGVHCCHVTIDGLIYNDRTISLNEGREKEKYMKMTSLANQIENIYNQPKDCWTLELDLRPYNENF